jgi:hypothetical protein
MTVFCFFLNVLIGIITVVIFGAFVAMLFVFIEKIID